MPNQLSIYRGALRLIGQRKLASLSEDSESRYVLDDIWDDQFKQYCLEQGLWNHAMRTMAITYSPSITPPFGYRYCFDKPDDFVRIAALCEDQYFNQPLIQYQDEANYWFCDLQTIYVRYVSSDLSYGNDLSLWPASYTRYVEHELALRALPRLKDSSTDEDALEAKLKRAKMDAKSKDAQKESPQFPPESSWNRSRRARAAGFRRPPYR